MQHQFELSSASTREHDQIRNQTTARAQPNHGDSTAKPQMRAQPNRESTAKPRRDQCECEGINETTARGTRISVNVRESVWIGVNVKESV
jgi:hypothetical protein